MVPWAALFGKMVRPKAEFINSIFSCLGPLNFCKEFGWAATAFEYSLGRPFGKTLGPKTDFTNSVSGGLGPINFCKESGWAAIAAESFLGRPFWETG